MTVRRLLKDRSGASAAEFAMVLPLLLLLMFGIIDVGRYMWSVNRAEKAAQMGVRMAVVTKYVSSEINANYVGRCSLQAGDTIPSSCFTPITCSRTGGTASCTSGTADTTAFNRVLTRIQDFMPEIRASNLRIIYSPSGLGYAGDPNGPDVAPLVTVELSALSFRPTILLTLADFDLPVIHSSLTFEDGRGVVSN